MSRYPKRIPSRPTRQIQENKPSEYSSDPTNQLKKIGFTNFYQLYKLSEFGLEVELCVMATR